MPASWALLLLAASSPTARSLESAYVDTVTEYCYQHLIADQGCCRDTRSAEGVLSADIKPGSTAWNCDAPADGGRCLDAKRGLRGGGRLWWPAGATCSSPRILYLHGGNWRYYGPSEGSYDVLASKIAEAAQSVVLLPDYRLVPVGNYAEILRSLHTAWLWLAKHGPDAQDCGASPPPLFVGGDSAGGGTGLSFVLRLEEEEASGPRPAGFFGFSPWTNLACDTPTYYSSAFFVVKDDTDPDGDYTGDIITQGLPRNNSATMQSLALEYVAGDRSLLMDPVASPLHADTVRLRRLPPLYFAVSSTESMFGDSAIFAGKAAQHGIPVVQDVFDGMWRGFPLYSEGCGSGRGLWQGALALRRTGEFVRAIASGHGASLSLGSGAPRTSLHYLHPLGGEPWVPILPLAGGSGSSGQAASSEQRRHGPWYRRLLPAAPRRLLGRRLRSCTTAALAGAFLSGAVGGSLFALVALGAGFFAWSRVFKNTAPHEALYKLLAEEAGCSSPHHDSYQTLLEVPKSPLGGTNRVLQGMGGDLVRPTGRVACLICALDYEGYGAQEGSSLRGLCCTAHGSRFAELASSSGAEVREFYDKSLPRNVSFPRREWVLSEMRRYGKALGPDDTFVFFFSGHSMQSRSSTGSAGEAEGPGGELCFVEPDGCYSPLRNGDLAELLLSGFNPATRLLVVTDCCQNGKPSGLCGPTFCSRAICHMSAMRKDDDDAEAGAFTTALLQALGQLIAKGGQEVSIVALHNQCLECFSQRFHNQDLAFECSPDFDPDTFAWPLVPSPDWSREVPKARDGNLHSL